MSSKQQLFRDLASDLVACALIEGARPTSMTASVETKAAKERLLDAIESALQVETRDDVHECYRLLRRLGYENGEAFDIANGPRPAQKTGAES